MAKKRQRRVPKVPRSTHEGRLMPVESALQAGVPARRVTETQDDERVERADWSTEYAYVRHDLMRIFILAVIFFGAMGVLKFLGY